MKLVLLPGMDGTGELFAPLLKHLSKFDVEVIAYPQVGGQDYQKLIDFVSDKLPNEKYVLIAESFSGLIAASLAKEGSPNMVGVIFVASFISPPNTVPWR